MVMRRLCFSFFFFNDTATTEIYTLSLHDALPISGSRRSSSVIGRWAAMRLTSPRGKIRGGKIRADRKSTRLNSSHGYISYAVFCLKKKKHPPQQDHAQPIANQAARLWPTTVPSST